MLLYHTQVLCIFYKNVTHYDIKSRPIRRELKFALSLVFATLVPYGRLLVGMMQFKTICVKYLVRVDLPSFLDYLLFLQIG